MAKRWKVIRQTLAGVGYTSISSVADITITSIDADGTLYYTDEFGDAVKVLYPSDTPIVVNSDTHSITLTIPHVYLAGVSGYTTAVSVVNEHNLDVRSECTFRTASDLIVSTGGTYNATLTAVATGSTLLTVRHNDGATISGTSTITVGQVNTILTASGGSMDTGGTGAIRVLTGLSYNLSAVTIKNQFNAAVTVSTAKLYYIAQPATTSAVTNAVLAANTTMTWTQTGVKTLVFYDYNAKSYNATYTGATYTVTVV